MRVTFLGTSGAIPTTERNPSALMVEREGERLLFDCGEGTQRQMMRYGTGFNVTTIFLTHLHGDHVLGLPGLVQTWDFQDRTAPLEIVTPRGTAQYVEQLLTATGDSPAYSLSVTEAGPDEVVRDADGYAVRTVAVDHRTKAIGYALIESERKGRFDREYAEEELGIPPGSKYARLHDGEPVEHDGRTVRPDEVVGPPRPGRRFVYTGDTAPSGSVVRVATDADLLVHDGSFAHDHVDRARETAHSTARQAAQVANEAGAKRLALTHVSTRYAGSAHELADEVAAVFEGETAFVAEDGLRATVPFPENPDGWALDRVGD